MTIITKQYNAPGEYQIKLRHDRVGRKKEWWGVMRAEGEGDYKLKVLVEHLVRGTKGKVVVRAVVSKGARVVLSGMININKAAQQTDSYLELRVLLLDETASATVDPQLEILANEVKVGHAASVGKIDEEQIRYLRSRGIDGKQARELIIEGFLKGE